MTEHPELSEFERKQIISALEQLLSTEKFVAAPQMSAFLRYVVEQSVAGKQNRIKAYTVAVDALGKADTFDPQNDPVVRVLAGRLRSSLDAYYETHADTNVVIQMKPGSYVPAFINKQNLHVAGTASELPPQNEGSAAAENASTANADQKHSELNTSKASSIQSAPPHASIFLKDQNSDKGSKKGILTSLVAYLQGSPKTAVAMGVLTVLSVSYITFSGSEKEPAIRAASPLSSANISGFSSRIRPEHLSIFVSAIDRGNSLENQLNSMMSGVFSESENVRVYRILDSTSQVIYWPEDYVLSLEVLPLASETQVGIQLMAGRTGRIGHTDTITLSSEASQRLTHEELELITDFSRKLVAKQGPLVRDYKSVEPASKLVQ
ncbi:MAG: hypothetical protein AB8B79_13915 [Granulosicoccus sp.]